MHASPIIHKLLRDIVAFILLTLAALTFSELVFPGFLTGFMSLTTATLILAAVVGICASLAPVDITPYETSHHRWSVRTMIFLGVPMLVLLAVALRQFALWETTVILLLITLSVIIASRHLWRE